MPGYVMEAIERSRRPAGYRLQYKDFMKPLQIKRQSPRRPDDNCRTLSPTAPRNRSKKLLFS